MINLLLGILNNKVALAVICISIATIMLITTGNILPLIESILKLFKRSALSFNNPIIRIFASKIATVIISFTISTIIVVTTGNFIPLINSGILLTNKVIEKIINRPNGKTVLTNEPENLGNTFEDIPEIDRNGDKINNSEEINVEEHGNDMEILIEKPIPLFNKPIIWDEEQNLNNLLFYINNLSTSPFITISGYTGNIKSFNIPEKIGGIPITIIENNAFENKHFEQLFIPNTVKVIEGRAFFQNNIDIIIIPNSVMTIGAEAFLENPLKNITIGNNVSIETDGIGYDFVSYYMQNRKSGGTYLLEEGKWNYKEKYWR
jgi:hypothetical protein